MPYAIPADLLKRFDARTIGDLAGDSGTEVSATDIVTDANVLELLADATGEIDSAMLVGGLYSQTDLAALTGADANKLVRLTCDIAMHFLYERRPLYDEDRTEAYRKRYREALEDLRTGKNLFNIGSAITAGKPSIDGPTVTDYDRLNLLPERTRRFYPGRATRLPTNRDQ